MQDAVHRLLYIFFIHIYRFLCNLLPELSTQFVPIISGFSTFFFLFHQGRHSKFPFFGSSPSVHAIQLCGAYKVRFHRRPLFTIRCCYYPTHFCRILVFSEITETKNLLLLSQHYSANKIFFFLCRSSLFYMFTSMGFCWYPELWTVL